MKKSTIREIATSYTTLIFLVIAISGLMMFFHFNSMSVKQLHNILGLVFIIAAIAHVIMNWKSMKNYFSKKIFIVSLITTVIVSALFVSLSPSKTENPKVVLMTKVLEAPIEISFKILNGNYNNAIEKLKSKNILINSKESINSIAKQNNTSPFRIVALLTSN